MQTLTQYHFPNIHCLQEKRICCFCELNVCSSVFYHHSQGSTSFPKIKDSFPDSGHQKGDLWNYLWISLVLGILCLVHMNLYIAFSSAKCTLQLKWLFIYYKQPMNVHKVHKNHTSYKKIPACFSTEVPSSANQKYKGVQTSCFLLLLVEAVVCILSPLSSICTSFLSPAAFSELLGLCFKVPFFHLVVCFCQFKLLSIQWQRTLFASH
jgi:hypothetical protein